MNPFFHKIIIAVTGLLLCLFMVVHLSANCLLILPEEMAREWYNSYSAILRDSLLIKVIAYVLYVAIALHVVAAIMLSYQNKKAKPKPYEVNKKSQNSSWSSQNMGFLGVLILLFIVVHLANFWARIKLGIGQTVPIDPFGNLDVYQITVQLFQNLFYVLFYSILAIPLGFHLFHGLKSAFKTLGFYHKTGLRLLANFSMVYAILIAIGFGIIPIIVFLK